MELRQLRYFVAVVDLGGFTRAATALHVAQPSLSQAIRALERSVGAALFHRLGRSVRLTAAGEALLGSARAALRDVDSGVAAVAAVAGTEAGHLDLVCLPTLAVDPTVRLVGLFRERHAQVAVRLQEPETSTDLVAMVRDGRSEVGVTDGLGPSAGLVVTALGEQPYAAVMPPGTPLARRRGSGAPWGSLPLITTPPGTSTRSITDRAFDGAGIDPVIGVETSHREALVPLVLAGVGMSILPMSLADEARRRGAVTAVLDPPVTRSLSVVHRDAPLSPAAAGFMSIVVGTAGAARP